LFQSATARPYAPAVLDGDLLVDLCMAQGLLRPAVKRGTARKSLLSLTSDRPLPNERVVRRRSPAAAGHVEALAHGVTSRPRRPRAGPGPGTRWAAVKDQGCVSGVVVPIICSFWQKATLLEKLRRWRWRPVRGWVLYLVVFRHHRLGRRSLFAGRCHVGQEFSFSIRDWLWTLAIVARMGAEDRVAGRGHEVQSPGL